MCSPQALHPLTLVIVAAPESGPALRLDPEPGPGRNGADFEELHALCMAALPTEMLELDLPGRDHALYLFPIRAIDTFSSDHTPKSRNAFLGYWIRRGAIDAVLQKMSSALSAGVTTVGPETVTPGSIGDVRIAAAVVGAAAAGSDPEGPEEGASAPIFGGALFLQEVRRIDSVMQRVQDNGLDDKFLALHMLRAFAALSRSGRRDGKAEPLADMIDWYAAASGSCPVSFKDCFTCYRIRWEWGTSGATASHLIWEGRSKFPIPALNSLHCTGIQSHN